jgi:dihydrofolate reductase
MRKITTFNFLTLNGFFKGPGEATDWHNHGEEENRFSEDQMFRGNVLLFGRKTYELMNSYWPTDAARAQFPVVAEQMNKAEKWVVSRSLQHTDWQNSRLLEGELTEAIARLKATEGPDISILGSGEIASQLTDADLIDRYELMIDPVFIGSGTTFLGGISTMPQLKLVETRAFSSGTVLLIYERKQR